MRWTLSAIVCLAMFLMVAATACVPPNSPGAVAPAETAPQASEDEPAMPPDMGQQCDKASDCGAGTCVKSQKFTLKGYCSKTCTDWPECPTYWSCGTNPVNNALACIQPPA